MKKIYIIGFLALAAGIVMMISASNDVSKYASFEDAEKGNRVKVVGQLSKDKEMTYNPNIDANLFKFFMKDDKGMEKEVNYIGAKPQDFEMSESIVITGKLQEDVFIADEMLLKCPSKYKGEEELINAQAKG